MPVLAHPLVEPDKGTGLVMVCTFGDLTDVTWWRELSLPVRAVLGEDGRLQDVPWGEPGWESQNVATARASYEELRGRSVNQARRRIVELLAESGELIGEPEPVNRAVKFFEKGERPVEIITSRQWFFKTVEHRDALIARGRELEWHPPYMRARYEDWVNGLTGDWCVSRQRFFGVPFPVWYPLDESGTVLYEQPIPAATERLPVDPSTDVPDGYAPEQRGQPGGFAGDPDVMDTWATSSLTPQIAGLAGEDPGPVRAGVPDGYAPPGPRHHQDLAVHDDPALAPGCGRAAVARGRAVGLGARPRPQEDVQVAAATSSRRCTCWRSTARTPCATGRPTAGREPTRRSTPSR